MIVHLLKDNTFIEHTKVVSFRLIMLEKTKELEKLRILRNEENEDKPKNHIFKGINELERKELQDNLDQFSILQSDKIFYFLITDTNNNLHRTDFVKDPKELENFLLKPLENFFSFYNK